MKVGDKVKYRNSTMVLAVDRKDGSFTAEFLEGNGDIGWCKASEDLLENYHPVGIDRYYYVSVQDVTPLIEENYQIF